MGKLLIVLAEIVKAEYAQWMRYVYVLSLGNDFNDQLAADEMEHAAIINRWLVDLGGLPPIEVPPIDPSCDSADILLQYEAENIELYTIAYEIATIMGIHGLAYDIGGILSKKQEHVSGLQKMTGPQAVEDDVNIVILAEKFRLYASTGGDLFHDLVVDKIIGFYHRAQKEFPKTQMAFKLVDYLRSMFGEATDHVLQQLGDDTDKIVTELPEMSRQYIVQDIEETVRELWPDRSKLENRSALEFYKDIYEWLTTDDIVDRWSSLYENYNPGWRDTYKNEWQQELDVGGTYRPSMDEIFQQLEPSESQEEVIDEPAQSEIDDQEIQRMVDESNKSREDWDEQQQQQAKELSEEPVEEPDARRPVTESIEQNIKVLDPDTKKKTFEVGVGDIIYNQTASQIFKQNREYGINRNQANQYATGTIKEIRDDSLLVSVPVAEEEFNEQIWPIDNKLWGSREKGNRLVNADYHEENYYG